MAELLRPLEGLGVDQFGAVYIVDSVARKVRKIEPDGQKFDPNLHQAMFEVPNTEVPNGTVVQTVQSGFVIGDRVLRPALVGVSKGGPKAAPAS